MLKKEEAAVQFHRRRLLRLTLFWWNEYAENTKNDLGFNVPKIYWNYTTKKILTLDKVEGISIREQQKLQEQGIDLKKLSKNLIQFFLKQAVRDGFFHGDMHQGNLKCRSDGTLIVMDFGIMGRIDEYTRRTYAEILIGFLRRDYLRVAEVHFEAGYVPENQNVQEFSQALRSVGEPIFGMEASDISMAKLLARLLEVTEQFGMETRTELLLLQRTMVVVEGVSRSLDANMNMWETARPVVEKYIAETLGPKAIFKDILKSVQVLRKLGPQLPKFLEDLIRQYKYDDKN